MQHCFRRSELELHGRRNSSRAVRPAPLSVHVPNLPTVARVERVRSREIARYQTPISLEGPRDT
eukprot:14266307-Alexandrium_andersonii.AAC.1